MKSAVVHRSDRRGRCLKRTVFLLGSLFVLGAVAFPDVSQATPVLNPANGHYYEAIAVDPWINWYDANTAAQSSTYGVPGHLATITSEAENTFIYNNLPSAFSGEYWVGGYQDLSALDYWEPGGGWRWVTGEPWSYANWAPGEPNDSSGFQSENHLMLWGVDGPFWNDGIGPNGRPGYVVEYDTPFEWSGILQPINADGTSVFKAGSTVPVKFALTGESAGITTLVATLAYAKVSDGVAGAVNEADSTSAATTGNLFRYSSGQYVFNWSTRGLTPGTYELQINLGDGVIRTARLGLK